jgi:hypothetical protein
VANIESVPVNIPQSGRISLESLIRNLPKNRFQDFRVTQFRMDCDAVWCCGMIPTFRRTLLPPPSGWRHEDGGSMGPRNVAILPQHYTASQLRRPRLNLHHCGNLKFRMSSEYFCGRSDDRGSIPVEGWEFFSLPPPPDRLRGPPSLLSNGRSQYTRPQTNHTRVNY